MATVTGTKRHLAIDSDTLNTGQGANELYDMDQNVLTTSDPTFASLAITNNITVGGTVDGRDVAADGAKAVTAHGWGNHASAGYATGDNFDSDGTFASLRAQGTTKGDVGLGNVTNESKATMFTSPTFTGTTVAPTPSVNDDSTKIATTAYVQQELTDLIGTAPSTLDTLGELSASLAADQSGLASLTTTVGTKLAKASNLSDLANAGTARTNLGLGTAATSDTGDFATAAQGAKADTAHGWGNHASAGYSTATGVENNADVTDTANVTAAGALMDSEVTNLAEVKAFDSSDYATAAQGGKADTAHGWGNHASAGYGTSNLALGTTSTTALAGNTTTITTAQANAITANTAKTGITSAQASAITANTAKTGITSGQASAITANTAKRDAQYIYIPIVCNFYGDLSTGEYHVPFSDGETESTSTTNRRNQFVAPCDGNFHKVIIRSNNSTLERGSSTDLTIKSKKVAGGTNSVTTLETKVIQTAAAETAMSTTFNSSTSAFSEGDRLLLSLNFNRGVPRGDKSFFVTVVFRIDQADLD